MSMIFWLLTWVVCLKYISAFPNKSSRCGAPNRSVMHNVIRVLVIVYTRVLSNTFHAHNLARSFFGAKVGLNKLDRPYVPVPQRSTGPS